MPLPDVLPVLGLEGIVLLQGGHAQREKGVCAMEAVAWLAGEPHSDHPTCTCPVIGAFLRSWNDGIRDDETRTRLIRPLLPIVLNTRSTKAVELTRSYLALDWLVRVQAPAWLSLRDDLKAHAVALRGLTPLTDTTSCGAAQKALNAARDAAGAAARDAAWAAARAAAGAAAWDAARDAAGAAAGHAAGDAAAAAAWDAARDAAWAAARDAAWAAARDAARDAAWAAAWAAAGGAAGAAARAAAGAAAGAAARAAAGAGAGDALKPTVETLQVSAADLVRRMCAVQP